MVSNAQEVSLIRRVGILGDIHAEDQILKLALDYLHGVPELDALLCTGDIPTGQGDAGRCCDLLEAANVLCVRGNHDRWLVAGAKEHDPLYLRLPYATEWESLTASQFDFLAHLPVTRSFSTPRGPLLLCHGTDTNDMDAVYPQDSRAVLSANHRLHALYSEGHYKLLFGGHTHERMLRKFDHLTLLNAGTLRRDFSPAFLVVDFEASVVRVYEIDTDDLTICPAKEALL